MFTLIIMTLRLTAPANDNLRAYGNMALTVGGEMWHRCAGVQMNAGGAWQVSGTILVTVECPTRNDIPRLL